MGEEQGEFFGGAGGEGEGIEQLRKIAKIKIIKTKHLFISQFSGISTTNATVEYSYIKSLDIAPPIS